MHADRKKLIQPETNKGNNKLNKNVLSRKIMKRLIDLLRHVAMTSE